VRGGALPPEKEKDTAKEAFDAAAFSEFFFGPGRRQARAVFLAFGVPRNYGDGAKGFMNPVDEAQAPIGSIKANDPWTNAVESSSDF